MYKQHLHLIASQVSQHTHSYTFDALLCVASLRRTGSSLPVELWHQAHWQECEPTCFAYSPSTTGSYPDTSLNSVESWMATACNSLFDISFGK